MKIIFGTVKFTLGCIVGFFISYLPNLVICLLLGIAIGHVLTVLFEERLYKS